jgi:hypothetical protein
LAGAHVFEAAEIQIREQILDPCLLLASGLRDYLCGALATQEHARSRGRETTAATGTAATTSGGDEQEETRTVSATLVA